MICFAIASRSLEAMRVWLCVLLSGVKVGILGPLGLRRVSSIWSLANGSLETRKLETVQKDMDGLCKARLWLCQELTCPSIATVRCRSASQSRGPHQRWPQAPPRPWLGRGRRILSFPKTSLMLESESLLTPRCCRMLAPSVVKSMV